MAFGGAQTNLAAGARTGQGQFNILEVGGVTLAASVANPPVRANADTGVLTSNNGAIDAVPANTNQMPAGYGKGPDDWAQGDVDAITIVTEDLGNNVTRLVATKALVANVNPAPAVPPITNANVEITVQNKAAALASGALVIRLISEHTAVR